MGPVTAKRCETATDFTESVFRQKSGSLPQGIRPFQLIRSTISGRWCMNMVWAASPLQACVLFDTNGDRHAEAGHLVKGVAGDFGFGPLIGQSPGMETPADDGLVAIHRRFDEAPPAIARATLPANAAVVLDRSNMVIALRRAGRTENGGRPRRDDHPRRGMSGQHLIVDRLAVIGALGGPPNHPGPPLGPPDLGGPGTP